MSYYPKTCNFTICSIFSNNGHVDWCTASPDTILKLDTLVMIQTKFGSNWSSSFREDVPIGLVVSEKIFEKVYDVDGCQMMAIAHMALWAR